MSSSNVRNAVLYLIAVFPAICLAEYKVDCPKSVEYETSISVPAGGWNAGFRPGASSTLPPKAIKHEAAYLEAVLYFEGDVDDAVELKGFTGRKHEGANARIIELDAERDYSAMCLYADDLVQWKQLPRGLKRCINVERKGNSPHKAFCE